MTIPRRCGRCRNGSGKAAIRSTKTGCYLASTRKCEGNKPLRPAGACDARAGGKSLVGYHLQALAAWRQPHCEESGVGFVAPTAENPTPLWSHQTDPLSDEAWLPEGSAQGGWMDGKSVRQRHAMGVLGKVGRG